MGKTRTSTRQAAPRANAEPAGNGNAEKREYQAPSGYQERGGDVVGFWDPDSGEPLHWVPREAILFDNKTEKTKPSVLVIGTLVDPVTLYKGNESNREEINGQSGDTVGVFAKPGMKAMKNLAQTKVYMYPDGEKDTGKPNPMKLFKVLAAREGKALQVTEDRRDKSRHAATFLTDPADPEDVPQRRGRHAPEQPGRGDAFEDPDFG